MPEVLGPNTILARALPTGVDGGKIAQWRLREGTTFGAFVGRLSQAVGAFNQELINRWGFLLSTTEELMLEYPDGSSVTEMPEITDLSDPDQVHGTTIGHMLPLDPYGRAIGGSWMYFRDAREAKIRSDLATIMNQARWRFEKKLLTRFFTNTENLIGSAGYDVPFVRGSGGNVDFIPPAFAGKEFLATHDHFIGYDSDTNPKTMADVLNGLAATLAEHGHEAPFEALVSRTDIDSGLFHALDKFIEFVSPVIVNTDRGGLTSGNIFYASGEPMVITGLAGFFQSKYGTVNIRASARIPTGYVGMTKSYGNLSARNALAVRLQPEVGFGAYVIPETSDDRQWPIKRVVIAMEFGVGVGEDRTNGACGYLSTSGSWSNPTIT